MIDVERLNAALAPFLARLDATEALVEKLEAENRALSAANRAQDLIRHEKQLVEARKRFKASLVAEVWKGETTVAEAICDAELILEMCGLEEYR